jgi:hypothetical protein
LASHVKRRAQFYVFENRVLRRIFGPKRDEARRLEKVANEELHGLYTLANIIRIA